MADFSDAFAPSEVPGDTAVVLGGPKPLPGGLKAVCIVAIFLGATGTIAAFASGVGLVFGQQVQNAMNRQPPGDTPVAQEAQQQLQTEINAVASKYIIAQTAAALLHLLTAVLLLTGGVMALTRKIAGIYLLLVGFAVSIVYVLGETILGVLVQLQALPLYKKFGAAIMAEAQGKGGNAGVDGAANFLLIMVFVGLAFGAILSLVKIIFYLIGIFYVRRPHIRELMRS